MVSIKKIKAQCDNLFVKTRELGIALSKFFEAVEDSPISSKTKEKLDKMYDVVQEGMFFTYKDIENCEYMKYRSLDARKPTPCKISTCKTNKRTTRK